jgi:hypothetical protein
MWGCDGAEIALLPLEAHLQIRIVRTVLGRDVGNIAAEGVS